jgi:hypothetical protein
MSMKIEAIWNELRGSRQLPAFRRISDVHPLDIYAGIDEVKSPILLLVTEEAAPDPGQFEALRIEEYRRDDGRWSYTLRLSDFKLTPLFALLCADLIDSTEKADPAQGARQFFARLRRWKALLAGGSTGLSEQETRGLLAELYVLNELLAPRFGLDIAALGWAGPEAEEQDFRIDDSSFEVKAVATGKTRVKIASLRQLDTLTATLRLLAVPLNPAAGSGAFSLESMVAEIREALGEASPGRTAFESKLLLVGYSDSDGAIRRTYSIGEPLCYEIIPGFPTLTPSTVPDGVVEASYTVDLSLCRAFERELAL